MRKSVQENTWKRNCWFQLPRLLLFSFARWPKHESCCPMAADVHEQIQKVMLQPMLRVGVMVQPAQTCALRGITAMMPC